MAVAALDKSAGSTTPAYSATQKAAAKTKLRDRYKLAGGAMHTATSAPEGDVAIARVSLTNEAVIVAAGTNARLPRIVQTVARAMARRSGVADNEIEPFRQVVSHTATRVLSAYPEHAPKDVADRMLLAAIDALIEGSEELARYHLAWHQTVAARHGGVLR